MRFAIAAAIMPARHTQGVRLLRHAIITSLPTLAVVAAAADAAVVISAA